jgi:hypothetical protein
MSTAAQMIMIASSFIEFALGPIDSAEARYPVASRTWFAVFNIIECSERRF